MVVNEKNVILDVQNLRTQFSTDDGLVQAVNGISISLREGETLGIVGESGCGKSVSMLSVMRLLHEPPAKITADRLYFMDTNIMALSKEEMRQVRGSQIAMIFQDPMTSLNPVLTIGFQLTEPLKLHLGSSDEEAKKRAAELLEMVGIPDAASRLNDYPHQFSGGMRQRAMIAMALACNPAILVADEPTTALDVTIQAQIVDLIRRLQEQIGMALIWITHDLGVIAGLADRVAVMYAGFIVETASVDDVYANPRHPYTSALLRSLAVDADYRNCGVATRLVGNIEDYAKSMDVDTLYLLTLTAETFFEKCGFRRIARDSAPAGIQETTEFKNLCPASAVCMVRHLAAVSNKDASGTEGIADRMNRRR